jgi:predicted DNA-binding transcriptional regulator AlpA
MLRAPHVTTVHTGALPCNNPPKGSIPDALKHFDSLPNSANVQQPVVEGLFDCSPATIWRRVRDGRLPKPRKLLGHKNTWNVGQLRASLKERTAGGGSHGS